MNKKSDEFNTRKKLIEGVHNSACIEYRGSIYLYYSHNAEHFEKSLKIKAQDKKKYENIWKTQFNRFQQIIELFWKDNCEFPNVKQVKDRMNVINNSKDNIMSLYDEFIKSKEDKEQVQKTTIEGYKAKAFYLQKFNEIQEININHLDNDFVKEYQQFLFNIERPNSTPLFIDGIKQERTAKIGLSDNFTFSILLELKAVIEFSIKNQRIKKYEIDWKSIFKNSRLEQSEFETLDENELKYLISKRGCFNSSNAIITSCPNCGNNELYKFNSDNRKRLECKKCGKYCYEEPIFRMNKEEQLKRALDLFIFQSLTSMAFVDASNPNLISYIKNNKIIIPRQKTKNNQEIPLTSLTKQILEENNYDFGFNKNNHYEYNRLIKTFMKRFSNEMPNFAIDRERKRKVNGNIKTEIQPRYMLISSHVARHTCISILINKGYDFGTIMKISGHRNLQIFLSYYNTRPIDNEINPLDSLIS